MPGTGEISFMETLHARVLSAVEPAYQVGQRVFGQHGATEEYFAGRVLAVHPGQLLPYVLDVGAVEPIHVLSSEIQSDLPVATGPAFDVCAWLLAGAH